MIYLLMNIGLIFLYYFYMPSQISNHFLSFGMVTLVFSIGVYFYQIKKDKSSFHWLSPTNLFLLGYIIVHFQVYLGLLFGYDYSNFIIIAPYVICRSMTLSLLGLNSFLYGFFLIKKRKAMLNKQVREVDSNMLLLAAYLFYILFFFSAGVSYRNGFYAVGDADPLSNYFFMLFNVVILSIYIFKFKYIFTFKRCSILKYLRVLGIPLLLITGWHILFSLYVGDRGPVISFSIILGCTYLYRFYKVKFIQLIIPFSVAILLMTLVRETRAREGENFATRFKAGLEKSAARDNRVFMRPTSELANSVRCLHISVARVPRNYEFMYGKLQVVQLGAFIPFFGRFYMATMTDGHFRNKGSANFITYLFQGDYPTYGDGTSCVADFYLDFGIIGVIFGFFCFGIFMKKINMALRFGTRSTLLLCFSLVYFFSSIYIGRASVMLPFKMSMLVYIVCRLNLNLTNRRI